MKPLSLAVAFKIFLNSYFFLLLYIIPQSITKKKKQLFGFRETKKLIINGHRQNKNSGIFVSFPSTNGMFMPWIYTSRVNI